MPVLKGRKPLNNSASCVEPEPGSLTPYTGCRSIFVDKASATTSTMKRFQVCWLEGTCIIGVWHWWVVAPEQSCIAISSCQPAPEHLMWHSLEQHTAFSAFRWEGEAVMCFLRMLPSRACGVVISLSDKLPVLEQQAPTRTAITLQHALSNGPIESARVRAPSVSSRRNFQRRHFSG